MKGVIHRMIYKNFFQKAPTQQSILQKTVTRKGCVRDLRNQDDNKSNTDPNPAPKPIDVVKDSVKLKKVAVPAEAHEEEDEPQRYEPPGHVFNDKGALVRDPKISEPSSSHSDDPSPGAVSDSERFPDSIYKRGRDAITTDGCPLQ